jgi:hypothetical protein
LGLAVAVGVLAAAGSTGGPEVDVSNLPGPQTNPTIAIDPNNAQILLAGSNDPRAGAQRIYSSMDGGATWQTATTFRPPANVRQTCASDPGVAIDARSRQYYSFDRATPCRSDGAYRIFVLTRSGPAATWSKPILVSRLGTARLDDKPSIAVDISPVSKFRNRVYLAWSRLSRATIFSIVLSHSDDGGRTWSKPVKVNRSGRELSYSSIAISRNGTVYVAWTDGTNFAVNVARSTDGGAHFGPERNVARFSIVTIPHCGSGIVIPALPTSCVQANPTLAVDASGGRYSGRVYVSFTQTEFYGNQGTFVQVFNSRLRGLVKSTGTQKGRAVAPAPRNEHADQFWPQSAVDRSSGALWVCYYDTRGDPSRKKASYSCTVSLDGGTTFAPPVHAASVASDETVAGALGQFGYYQGIAVANGVAHPIWTDTRDLGTLDEEIYTTALSEADLRPPAPSG